MIRLIKQDNVPNVIFVFVLTELFSYNNFIAFSIFKNHFRVNYYLS